MKEFLQRRILDLGNIDGAERRAAVERAGRVR